MHLGIDASRATRAQRTGTEGYAYHLITALLPLAIEAGHRVRLYFNQPPDPDLFPLAVASPSVELAVLPFPRLWTHLRLAADLQRDPPDLFFTPAHVIPLTYRGPSVATVHDLGYHHFPDAHPRRQRAYLRWSTAHNVQRSRVVLADSRATRDDIVQHLDAPADKIAVVYPGRDPSLQRVVDSAEIAQTCRRYALTPPYLLHIGTLQPRKNLVRLIHAFAAVADTMPHQLVLAGHAGWLAHPILDAIDSAPASVRDRIRVTGFVRDTDKAALLSGASALAFPSLYEGFGFPVIEAQQCGIPVVCANSSSLPEVAGDAALLVNPLDTDELAKALRRVVADTTLRTELIERGTTNARRFDWRVSAEKTLTVLETVAVHP